MANEVWGINAAQQIFQWNGTSWTQIPGALATIVIGVGVGEVAPAHAHNPKPDVPRQQMYVPASADATQTTGNPTWLSSPNQTPTVTPDPSSTWTWDPKSERPYCSYLGNGVMDANQPNGSYAQGALLWFRMIEVRPEPPGAVTASYYAADQGGWGPGETSKVLIPGRYLFQMNDNNLGDNLGSITLNITFS